MPKIWGETLDQEKPLEPENCPSHEHIAQEYMHMEYILKKNYFGVGKNVACNWQQIYDHYKDQTLQDLKGDGDDAEEEDDDVDEDKAKQALEQAKKAKTKDQGNYDEILNR